LFGLKTYPEQRDAPRPKPLTSKQRMRRHRKLEKELRVYDAESRTLQMLATTLAARRMDKHFFNATRSKYGHISVERGRAQQHRGRYGRPA
jgi:hypothetical protein